MWWLVRAAICLVSIDPLTPKEKLVVEERFFKPSSTSPLIRKMQQERELMIETKGRLCCFVLVVRVVHLKIIIQKTHAAQDVTLIKIVLPWVAKFVVKEILHCSYKDCALTTWQHSSYIRTNSGKYVRGSATQDYRTTYTKQNSRKLTYAYIHISVVHIRICAANDISIRNETLWKFRTAKTIGKTQTDGTWKWALKASFLLLSACSKLVWGVNSFLFGHQAWHMTVGWICHAI